MIGHINNLYNTTFWALIQLGGVDATEAEKALKARIAAVVNRHRVCLTCYDLGDLCRR